MVQSSAGEMALQVVNQSSITGDRFWWLLGSWSLHGLVYTEGKCLSSAHIPAMHAPKCHSVGMSYTGIFVNSLVPISRRLARCVCREGWGR